MLAPRASGNTLDAEDGRGGAGRLWKARRGFWAGNELNPALAFRLEQPRRADVIGIIVLILLVLIFLRVFGII